MPATSAKPLSLRRALGPEASGREIALLILACVIAMIPVAEVFNAFNLLR